MTPTDTPEPQERRSPPFRTTLIRVLVVQVISLILLWLLQMRYNG